MAVHLAVASDVFGSVFLCCPFSHEMSWMRSGTELSRFLRIFPFYPCNFRYDAAASVVHEVELCDAVNLIN